MIFLKNTPNTSAYFISLCNSSHETVIIIVLEIVAIPVCIKCGKSFLNDVRILLIGDAHIPL